MNRFASLAIATALTLPLHARLRVEIPENQSNMHFLLHNESQDVFRVDGWRLTHSEKGSLHLPNAHMGTVIKIDSSDEGITYETRLQGSSSFRVLRAGERPVKN